MRTLPYRFFPLAMLAIIPILLATKKDLGPLAAYPLPDSAPPAALPPSSSTTTAAGELEAAAEAAAAAAAEEEGAAADDSMDGPLAPKAGVPHRAINALRPFGCIALATFGGMLIDGALKLRESDPTAPLTIVSMLGESDSIAALIWASTIGWLVSMGLVLSQSILDLTEAMDAWIEGMKDVIAPMIVLLLAWALGDVIGKAKAADFLSKALQGSLPEWALPALISLLAHAISYACGSSFGTCKHCTAPLHALSPPHLSPPTPSHLPSQALWVLSYH